jgi:hypothetical protein
MRVFDESKTREIHYYDTELGTLRPDKLLKKHHEAVSAISEVVDFVEERHPNGGVSRIPRVIVPAVPSKPAWDEYEDILVYVPFTQKELDEKRAGEIKDRLSQLSEDFAQAYAGAQIPDIELRKREFADLHNELRVMLGKNPRIYYN